MLKTIALVSLLTLTTACTSTGTNTSIKSKNTTDLKRASSLNTELAVGYIKNKQYQEAKIKLEKAIEQNDDNLDAYKTLAYLYNLLGLTEKSAEKYEEALVIKDNDPDLLNDYGAFLCSQNKYSQAQEKFKQAYSNPFYKFVYLAKSNAGSCLIQQEKYRLAEKLLRESLAVAPKIPGSLISMSEIGLKTKQYLMARAYIQRYHSVHKPSADSLWIQTQTERALNAKAHYKKYAQQLIKDFPDSDQAGWIEAQINHDKK